MWVLNHEMQGSYQEINPEETSCYWGEKLGQPHLGHRLLGILQCPKLLRAMNMTAFLGSPQNQPCLSMLHLRHQCPGYDFSKHSVLRLFSIFHYYIVPEVILKKKFWWKCFCQFYEEWKNEGCSLIVKIKKGGNTAPAKMSDSEMWNLAWVSCA